MLKLNWKKLLCSIAAVAAAAVLAITSAGSTAITAQAAAAFQTTGQTQTISDTVAGSTYAILVNQASGTVIAQKNGNTVMYPASMTKVMTLLVAADYVSDLSVKITITQDIIDYCIAHDCSTVGFTAGETVTMMDLLWGTILPSGADAALALARYIAGSEEKFVALMNEKAAALGMTNTHFANCTGLYNDAHYSTCNDIAILMNAAVQSELALTVLATRTYTTTATTQHPSGISIKNLFLTRSDALYASGVVVSAKTGFINASGYCAVSYYVSSTGTPYICVTGNASSSLNAVYDHQNIYTVYTQ